MIFLPFINNNISYGKSKKYKVYGDKGFKSYEDADCITDKSSKQYKLKSKYKLGKGGVWTVNGRYCVALGSHYAKKIGTKIDLTLKYKGKKHIVKCILADQKADKDTVKNHTRHPDGSIAEFIVKTSAVHRKYGDISYANKIFKGKIVSIKVYSEKKNKKNKKGDR